MKIMTLEELKQEVGADLTLEICQKVLPEASLNMTLEELKQEVGADSTLKICQKVLPEASLNLEGLSLDDGLVVYKKADDASQRQGIARIIKEVFGVDIITSPIVGTFSAVEYWPHGEVKPLVSVGDLVEPETTVCSVTAMMVQNEIKAGVKGKIIKILAQDDEPVEYGQALFVVKPDQV